MSVFNIIQEVEQYYNYSEGAIRSHKRTKTLSEARAIAMYLARNNTEYSYPELGDVFNKHYTSVIYNVAKVANNKDLLAKAEVIL